MSDQLDNSSQELSEECKERLRKVSSELNKVIHDVEGRFLHTGEQLMKINEQSSEVSRVIQNAKHFLENSSGGILSEYLRIQKMVMDKLNDLTEHVREGLKEIRSKDVQIAHFRETCGFISNTSRNLSIIALNIKVQSGHLQENEESFFSFGKEIKSLASELAEVSNSIISDSLETQSMQRQQQRKIEEDLERFEDFIHTASASWQKIKEQMITEIQEIIPGFENANQCASNISKEISSVVVALQAHDIVRQKIEHVCEILDEIVNGMREPGKDILNLQANQLVLSLKEISKVKVVGVSAFTVIHKMLTDLMKIVADDEEETLTLCDILDDSLAGLLNLLEYLDQGENICANISDSINGAMKRVRLLEQYVEKAKEVNQSLEMKAINAIVMTAGLKRRSRPFRVLGQHVNELSRKSIVFADDIRGIIESIVTDRRELGLHEVKSERQEVKKEVAKLQEQFQELREQILKSSSGSRELQDMILGTGDSLVFLNGLVTSIETQVDVLSEMYCGVDMSDNSDDTDAVNRYTMESEREIYRKVYGQETAKKEKLSEEDDSVVLF